MKSGKSKSLVIKSLIAVIGIFLVLWLLDDSEAQQAKNETPQSIPQVSVIEVTPTARMAEINVTGTVKSRWPLTLNANVSGRLIDHVEHIQPGSFIRQGQLIAEIQDIDYVTALASAEARISQAKLTLARYLNEQSVAKHLETTNNSNEYRLFKPHVSAAKAELSAAQANYQSALKRVQDTKVKAPFDAIVLAKHTVPAQEINAGDTLYQLASSQTIDIEVHFASYQWQQIVSTKRDTQSDAKSNTTVNSEQVHHQENTEITARIADNQGNIWQGQLRFLSPTLNPQTRQQRLLLTIENPYQNSVMLYPEQQVKVSFNAAQGSNTILAPATVLTRDQQVWTVQNGRLVQEEIQLHSEGIEDSDQVLFSFSKQPSRERLLVRYPLSTMLAGQQVNPMMVKESLLTKQHDEQQNTQQDKPLGAQLDKQLASSAFAGAQQ
ncbi:efflux RND transporter periplasmic adaptor subunit [Thalassotalea montiporae]